MLSVSLLGGLGVLPRDIPTSTVPVEQAQTNQPAPGSCSMDGKFIWIGAAGTVAGHWERLRVGQQCTSFNNVPGPVEHTGAQGGVTVSPTRVMKVGPFTIPVVRAGRAYTWGLDDYGKLSDEAAIAISTQLQQKIDYPGRTNWVDVTTKSDVKKHNYAQDYGPGMTTVRLWEDTGELAMQSIWPATAPWGGTWLTVNGWLRKLGVADRGYEERYFGFDTNRSSPIMTFDHPDTGSPYGVFMRLQPVGPEIKAVSTVWGPATTMHAEVETTQSWQLQFIVKPISEDGFYEWIMKYVLKVVAAYIDGVVAAAQGISDALCAITATPGALTSAASAGGPYAAAAATGTELMLNGKCPVPNPTPSGDSGGDGTKLAAFPWGPVLAGGVAVLGCIAFVVAGSKKKPAPRKSAA